MEFTRLCEKEDALQMRWVLMDLSPDEMDMAKRGEARKLTYHLLMKNADAASALQPSPASATLRAAAEAAMRREKLEAAVKQKADEERAELNRKIAAEAAQRRRLFSELRQIRPVPTPVQHPRAAVRMQFRTQSTSKLGASPAFMMGLAPNELASTTCLR
ncbi:AKL1 [Symbiodinium necroappetens]|uniref:AKL1 protein n=1 Tax=Symbiodinium necroappetens TaxID=1628268 RepID=A0A812QK85_9DINO|nr:AKL1 [Symbiodinium necroappetens]